MSRPLHLLTVWNPSYTSDSMDEHIKILLDLAAKFREFENRDERLYVWWGKIHSARREAAKLPHIDKILGIQKQIERGRETHLYLTDYRSLYVAWIGEITTRAVQREEGERTHVPAYYRDGDFRFDCWFRLRDIRRIVSDDTLGVIEELKKLSNTQYDDKPVSLYGGVVDTPLIVTRERQQLWFASRGHFTEGAIWAEYDADRNTDTGDMARDLRDNLIGRRNWAALEVESRNFLATGEAIFRNRRDDPRFDFSPALVEYSKAIEVELNRMFSEAFRWGLDDVEDEEAIARFRDREINLKDCREHFTLGTIERFLVEDEAYRRCVDEAFPENRNWLLKGLPKALGRIRRFRNPAAHEDTLSRDEVDDIRNSILGIGCHGLVNEMIVAKLRGPSSAAMSSR